MSKISTLPASRVLYVENLPFALRMLAEVGKSIETAVPEVVNDLFIDDEN